MTKYVKIEDYSEFILPDEGNSVFSACCDCGLVHVYVLAEEVETGRTCVLAVRDERRTAQLRRHGYGDLHDGTGKWKLIRTGE